MNWTLIAHLIRLRYKLLWARTRTRNGKIAMFFAGYILLVMCISVLATGGIGAGVTAMQTGKGYHVVATVLAGLYIQAVLATVVLGFGVNSVFTDAELRRYPLAERERTLIRHLIGILDPFWYLILALELGLVVGVFAFGAGSFWLSLVAVLLLFVSNYLGARVLGNLVERLVSRRGGSTILMALIVGLGLLPASLQPLLKKSPHAMDPLVHLLGFTPPAAAARAMTHWDSTVLSGFFTLTLWIVVFTAALVALERMPIRAPQTQTSKVSFASIYDRVGSWFGPEHSVLVAQWLRFYSRNNRFRMIYPTAVPLMAALVLLIPRQSPPERRFLVSLGTFTVIGFIGVVQFAVNQFGYLGGGLRRYFLLPGNPAAILRSGSYVFVLLGCALMVIGTLFLLVWPPIPLDASTVVLFVSSAVAAMFLLNGIALWVTLFSPRRGNYNASFGNDLSFAGNVLVIGAALIPIFVPPIVATSHPNLITPGAWWIALLAAAAAVGLYFVSLRRAEEVFVARRELLLSVIEGRA